MKNIFCLFAILLLFSLPKGTMAEEAGSEFIDPGDAVRLNGTFGPARNYEQKMRPSESPETGKEVLIDGSALRKKNDVQVTTETTTETRIETKVPRDELAKMLENDTAFAGDKEILEALSAAGKKQPEKAGQTDKSGNVYGKPYGLSDVKYFPSRRRSSR